MSISGTSYCLKALCTFYPLFFKNGLYCSYLQSEFMDTSAWVGVILDSDIIIQEMDPDTEYVSTYL